MRNPQSTISPTQNTTALIADLAHAHGVLQDCLRQEAAQNFRTLSARKKIAEIEEEIAWAMREEETQRAFDAAIAEQCDAALSAGHNPGRVQQAAELVRAGAVRQDHRKPYGGRFWWVASQSHLRAWPYHVEPESPGRPCGCADSLYNGPPKCKHALACIMQMNLERHGVVVSVAAFLIEHRQNGHK